MAPDRIIGYRFGVQALAGSARKNSKISGLPPTIENTSTPPAKARLKPGLQTWGIDGNGVCTRRRSRGCAGINSEAVIFDLRFELLDFVLPALQLIAVCQCLSESLRCRRAD